MEDRITHRTNNKMIPLDVLRGIQSTWTHSKGDADYSVTELLSPPKVRALKIINKEDITEDYSDSIATFIGTSIHKTIEDANKDKDDCLTEERMEVSIKAGDKTITISGTVDHYHTSNHLLTDYKTTGAYGINYEKPEWTQQLNIYRWMFSKVKEKEMPDAQIIAILKDWSKPRSINSNTYPPSPVMVKPIANWSEEEIIKFIMERIALHEKAIENPQEILCSDEERWLSPKGVYNRCEHYCNVNKFCDQYIGEKNGE
tara:strand:+ start:6877 stop:7650 length:774 start_codon:yes stop_codon:yes gene_type:complete